MEQNNEIQQIERTESQRAASRANGTHSRGPVTPAGKAASARSALRHGLCARTLTLASENPEMLTTLLNDLTAEFQPHTPAERLLFVEMAQAKRHQYRIWLSETSHLNQKMAETAETFTRTHETFDEPARNAIAIDGPCDAKRKGIGVATRQYSHDARCCGLQPAADFSPPNPAQKRSTPIPFFAQKMKERT